MKIRLCRLASWSSGNAFVSGAGGLRFKSRAGQIGHSVAKRLATTVAFFGVAHRRNDAEMGPANSLHASAYYSEYNERKKRTVVIFLKQIKGTLAFSCFF